MDRQAIDSYLAKAEESLHTAESEYANRRYNSCANRCYYACFQAALAALGAAGIGPRGQSGQWGHDYVQAAFVGQLINRRKQFPARLRDVLPRTYELRQTADYETDFVTQKQAERTLRRSRELVEAIRQGGVTG